MHRRRLSTPHRTMIMAGLLLPLIAVAALIAALPGSLTFEQPLVTATFQPEPRDSPSGQTRIMLLAGAMPTATVVVNSASGAATLTDFWNGKAEWVLETPNTGLPVGESDTIDMGNGVFWSYLHASDQSAGVVDSCGNPVQFPGCVTRWIGKDGGKHFALAEPN